MNRKLSITPIKKCSESQQCRSAETVQREIYRIERYMDDVWSQAEEGNRKLSIAPIKKCDESK